MPSIRVLPINLVNKIAAGEVIERPASIVKELLENAIDAGASKIDIAVEDGGRKLISITDDGSGMSEEDLALSFAPHATSKLQSEDDLFAIATMGFRGEALASIASISHANIRTRRSTDEGGHEIQASGGQISNVKPCPAAPGTTVIVRDLFFNTPARRKFLKTTNTELAHITEQLARIALPQPKIAFSLTHNGREIQKLPATDSTRQRIADIFGADTADGLLSIAARKGKIEIAGLAGSPSAARSSAKWQYIFLNGRYIRDRLLAHAVKEAYRGLMDPSRWPTAFVFIRIDPAEVDVNVHPTKIEVRFRDSQMVHGELLAALRETLNKANLTPTVSLHEALHNEPLEQEPDERRASLRQAMADFFKSVPPSQPRFEFKEKQTEVQGRVGACTHAEHDRPIIINKVGASTHPTPCLHKGLVDGDPAGNKLPALQSDSAPKHLAIQLHNSYIVAETPDGVMIIDQHALHERLIYNDLKRRLAAGPLTGQRLLIPQTITVTPTEADLLHQHAELLAKIGIEVEPFGPKAVAIQQFPTLLAERGIPAGDFLRDIIDSLSEDHTAGAEKLLESLLETLACKAAIKAGQPLSDGEIDELISRHHEADEKVSSCPHGRPTVLKLTLRELEKQFKRT